MNYIKYDPRTGAIEGYGYMADALVLERIEAGEPLLLVDNVTDEVINQIVNLGTMQLEPIPQEATSE